MGISQAEIENMRTRAREAGFGVDDAQADVLRTAIAATTAAQAGDMERIIVEGQEVIIEANASEGERRNAQARLDSDVIDAAREAERAGTRAGRIEITGLGSKDKERAQTDSRRRANNDARTQALLALQAALDGQLAALDLQIAETQQKIDDIEKAVFTREELEEFDKLPPDERFDAVNAAMREKVANGKMSQAQYDEWLRLNEKQRELQARRDALADFKDLLEKDPDKALEATADGTAFKNPIAEKLAQQIDDQRASRGEPPIDRRNVSEADKRALGVHTKAETTKAQLEQVKTGEEQKAVAGSAAGNEAQDKHEFLEGLKSFESIDETIEAYMKAYATIEQIENPQERLKAEQEFVKKVRELAADEKLSDAAMEIEFADNTAHLFEEGYFDALKNEGESQHASRDQKQEPGPGAPGNTMGG